LLDAADLILSVLHQVAFHELYLLFPRFAQLLVQPAVLLPLPFLVHMVVLAGFGLDLDVSEFALEGSPVGRPTGYTFCHFGLPIEAEVFLLFVLSLH